MYSQPWGYRSPTRPAERRVRNVNERLLIVGWDGADWEILDDLLNRGDLPNLSQAISDGMRGDLESTLPTHSWAAWPTFLTGMHPAGHGVFDFVQRDRNDPRRRIPVTSASIGAPTFLEILSQAGIEVRAANIPVTFPPLKVRGRLIAGVAIPPRSTFVHPPEWGEHLQRVAPFPLNGLEWSRFADRQEQLIEEALELVERRTASYEALLEGAWTVAVCVYVATDRLQHPFGAHLLPTHPDHVRLQDSRIAERLRGVYRALDAALARLRARAGEDATFVLVSDHGFRPVTRVADIDRILASTGLAARAGAGEAIRSFRVSRLGRALETSRAGKALKARVRRPSTIDWRSTIAYQSGTAGSISLNVRGREPHGIVEPDDFLAVSEKVVDAMLSFEDPETGEHPVGSVTLRDALPSGRYLDRSPDLLVQAAPLWVFKPSDRVTSTTSWPSATHRRTGVIVASGGRTQTGDVDERSLADLAPTALAFAGIEPPLGMDGREIVEVAGTHRPAARTTAPRGAESFERESDAPTDEDGFVEQHLRDLGYID